MEISVIIPVYNAEASIRSCLTSVFHQTYQSKIEILVINDGSTDGSKKLIQEIIDKNDDPRFFFRVFDQKNGGVSSARNLGLKNSTGQFIALLDSDDQWLPEKLERQMQILHDHPEMDFLGCSRNNEVLNILWKEINTLHKASVKELLIKMFPQTSTAIFKRRLYEQFGGYNESMTHCEDGNLWVRYCARSNFYYMPDSLVITGNGKPSFGHSGLSANLSAMEKGNEFTVKEARKNGLISYPFYCGLYIFSKIKYLRRIIITKIR